MHISLDSALGRQRRLNSVGESVFQIAPDAAAGYSLRSLTGGDPSVVRVRRESDNGERDFRSSEINSGEMVRWVNQQITPPLDLRELTATGRDGPIIEAAAAYSLRNLSDSYTGSVADVRRPDGAVRSFTAAEVTDGTLTTWVNAVGVARNRTGSAKWGSFTQTATGFNASASAAAACGYDVSGLSGASIQVSFDIAVNSGSVTIMLRSGFESGSTVSNVEAISTSGSKSFTLTATSDFVALQFISASANIEVTNFSIDTPFSNDGTVSKWYDQSTTSGTPNAKHAVQTDAAKQPKIVSGGTLVAGGIDFDGVNDGLFTASNLTDTLQSATIFALTKDDTTSGTASMVRIRPNGGIGTIDGFIWEKISGKTYGPNTLIEGANGAVGTSIPDGQGTRNTSKNLNTLVYQQSKILAYKNGALDETISTVRGGSVPVGDVTLVDQLWLGQNFDDNNRPFNGTMQEVIIYFTDQSDNRTALEANIGEVYGIAGIPAYDDEVNAFVETWYDQSGNGKNATQLTAGNQPKIVNAGALVTGGLDFDGTNFLDISSISALSNKLETSVISLHSARNVATVNRVYGANFSGFTNSAFIHESYYSSSETKWLNRNSSGAAQTLAISASNSVQYLTFNIINSSAEATSHRNGGSAQSTSGASIATPTTHNSSKIGARSDGSSPLDGTIAEVIVYPSDQTANRLAIEANINNQYEIF